MKNGRDPVIVGLADAPIEDGKFVTKASVLGHAALVAKAAVEEAGLTLDDVDGLLTAGMWGVPGPGQLATVTLGEYLGIMPTYVDGTNIGGSAFEAHVAHAAMALREGYCEVALIVYSSDQKSLRSRNLGGRPSVLSMQHETPYGMPTPVGGYAMAAQRHMHEYGTTSENLAEIAVATRKWAQLNPAATRRDPLTVDDVLSSTMISEPLHLLDCCLVTDGAGAIVMTTAERAKNLRTKPVAVKGYGEAHTHWAIAEMPDLARLLPAQKAGETAMKMAGGGAGFLQDRRRRRFCLRPTHGTRRCLSDEHQWRRPVRAASGHVRDIPADRGHPPVAGRLRRPAGRGCRDRAGAWHGGHAVLWRDRDFAEGLSR